MRAARLCRAIGVTNFRLAYGPMIPVCDVIPSRSVPIAVVALLVVHAAAFAAQLYVGPVAQQALLDTYGVTPVMFSLPTIASGLFLHAGWVHAGTNLLYLWIFGENVEAAVGRAAFVLLYGSCAAAGAAAYVATHPTSAIPLVGASSAAAGIMGAYLVLYPRSRVLTAVVALPPKVVEIPAVFFAGLWFVLQLLTGAGAIGGVAADGADALSSHLLGCLVGAACGAYFRFAAGSLRRYWREVG